jgi:hypothetical protein
MRSVVKIGQIFKQKKCKDKDSMVNSQGCPYLFRGLGGGGDVGVGEGKQTTNMQAYVL